jgi:hypothetical protein
MVGVGGGGAGSFELSFWQPAIRIKERKRKK